MRRQGRGVVGAILRKRFFGLSLLLTLVFLALLTKLTIMCQHYFRQWEFSIVVEGQIALILSTKPDRPHMKAIQNKLL